MKQSRTAFSADPLPLAPDDQAQFIAFRALRTAARPEGQSLSPLRSARMARVMRSTRLTPNMQRVTIGGEELAGFPEGQDGAHIKLMLPAPSQSESEFAAQLAAGPRRPITRTYTIRHHRPDICEIDIDFALHEDGRACKWSVEAQHGDFLAIAGPSPKKMTDLAADWFLLAADMTAIPAAAAALEDMPADACGHAVFEIASPVDRQPVDAPPGIAIDWLVTPASGVAVEPQLEAMRALAWPSGRPGIFVAGESSVMKAVRQFLCEERGIERKAMYASAYWKVGLREDQHRKLKLQEAAACG